MPMTVEQIVEETAQWPVDAVAELLDRIALAKHGDMSAARMDAWTGTALRRCAELDSGQAELIPGAVASARIRKIVGR
ncbi:addiction module antitoxin RelB [Termitidicoccus mucosus]|uniref:Addiction module antitoxin RelB n=2 Tax=Termitidicoccus mucosus TaxID=1184151 RepID=A0A178IPW7_9BACT|nr:addiction module antitoxin RelB [Opitutaceae bacterium TSB47]